MGPKTPRPDDEDPKIEDLWAQTQPVHIRTTACLSIPRLAELARRELTEAESTHLDQCAPCRRSYDLLTAGPEFDTEDAPWPVGPHVSHTAGWPEPRLSPGPGRLGGYEVPETAGARPSPILRISLNLEGFWVQPRRAIATPRDPKAGLRLYAAPGEHQAREAREEFQLCGRLDDGRSIEFFSTGLDETFSIRIHGKPPTGRVFLRISGCPTPVDGGFDERGFARVRFDFLPGSPSEMLREGDLALILEDPQGV